MKILKYNLAFIFILLLTFSCTTDKDTLYSFDYIEPPSNVDAVFDITQDNSGFVTIVPNSEGATSYTIEFGDGSTTEINAMEPASHIYSEGIYQVGITATGITGLSTTITKELHVSFKAPEDLAVTIAKDNVNPKIVSVSATATYATVIDVYFGDVENEEPIHVLPGEAAIHSYAEPGDYTVKVIAKSAGAASIEYTEVITINAASDPVNLPIDFESFTVNYAFNDFGGAVSSVIDNPDPSGINTSAKVGQSVKTAGAETWAGTLLSLESPIDFSIRKSFKVKVWSPKANAVVKLKVENLNDGNISYEVDANTIVANEWEELTFDFSGINDTKEYQKIVLFFDFGNVGDDAVYYFDDIKPALAVVPPSIMIENFEGAVPVFTAFGNAAVEVINNPEMTGYNTTPKAVKFTKQAGAETWAGAYFEASEPLDLQSFSNIRLKTWSPKRGIIVKVKLENLDASITYEVDMNTTTINAWEELTYDFSTAPVANYMRIVVFFDFNSIGDGSVYYFDEVELANEGGVLITQSLENFEGDAPAFTQFGNASYSLIDNPDPTGINTTAKVVQFNKPAGAETWAGVYFEKNMPLDLGTLYKIRMKSWSPKRGIIVKLKLENQDASITHEVDVNTTITNAWEELTYDFSTAPVAEYVRVVIFYDFGNNGDNSVYYFDEIELTN